MMESGLKESLVVKESRNFLMGLFMMDSGLMGYQMEKAGVDTLMDQSIKVFGKMDSLMVRD